MPPPPRTACILHCPVEILRDIFELTSPHDLAPLSFVNKRLRRIVEPLLYSRIEWEWDTDTFPPLLLLLRSILNRPDLGTHVKCFILKGRKSWYGRPPPRFLVDEAGVLDKAILAVERTGVVHGDLWIRELCAGTVNAFVALLLSQLPGLRELRLSYRCFDEIRLIDLMFKSALCKRRASISLPRFDRLQDVAWNAGMKVYPEDGAPIGLPIFYLPGVKTIGSTISNLGFAWPAGAPDPSSLTSLGMRHAREPLLTHLLAVTRELRCLRWAWYHSPNWRYLDPVSNCPIIDLEQFSLAISQVRATLTDLVIEGGCDIGNSGSIEDPTLYIRGSITGLTHFDKLVRMEAALPFLMASFSPQTDKRLEDMLPKSLEYLGITDDFDEQEQNDWEGDDFVRLVKPWLGFWRQVTPRLRGISLVARDPVLNDRTGIWDLPTRQAVEEMCVQAGIAYKHITGG